MSFTPIKREAKTMEVFRLIEEETRKRGRPSKEIDSGR